EAERRPTAEDAGADHGHIGRQAVASRRTYRRRLRTGGRAQRAWSGDGKCPGVCTGNLEEIPTIHVTLLRPFRVANSVCQQPRLRPRSSQSVCFNDLEWRCAGDGTLSGLFDCTESTTP